MMMLQDLNIYFDRATEYGKSNIAKVEAVSVNIVVPEELEKVVKVPGLGIENRQNVECDWCPWSKAQVDRAAITPEVTFTPGVNINTVL